MLKFSQLSRSWLSPEVMAHFVRSGFRPVTGGSSTAWPPLVFPASEKGQLHGHWSPVRLLRHRHLSSCARLLTDVLIDPVWDIYRDRLEPFGIHAVWSHPLFTGDGTGCCQRLRSRDRSGGPTHTRAALRILLRSCLPLDYARGNKHNVVAEKLDRIFGDRAALIFSAIRKWSPWKGCRYWQVLRHWIAVS